MRTIKLQPRPKRLAASSAKVANAQRISEILIRYADDYYVKVFLQLLIERHRPEQQLSIVNEL